MMLAGFWGDWGMFVAPVSFLIILIVIALGKDSKNRSFIVRLCRHCLPEVDLFESEDRKRRALRQAIGNSKTCYLWCLANMVSVFILFYILPILYAMFPLVQPIDWIFKALICIGFLYSCLWLTRARIRRCLRQELINDGVPICEPCGYDLRDLTEPRCPECGATFDKKLLTDSTLQTEDSSQHDNSEY